MAQGCFKNITEDDKYIIQNICKCIEEEQLFFISTNNKLKIMSRENPQYTYDYTHNFIRFGFARKVRGTDFMAKQHLFCPNQHCAQLLASFINNAVELGLYKRKTLKNFNGGNNIQIIWMN